MNVFLEFVVQEPLSVLTLLLLVELLILFDDIFTNIAIFLFDCSGNVLDIICWNRLLTFSKLLHDEFRDVGPGERDMLDTGADDEAC